MAEVWIDKAGWKNGDLPDVCMECGADAPDRVRKTLTYLPRWVWVTLLLGVIVLAIVIAVTREEFSARVPLCPAHKKHWRKREFQIYGAFVLVLLLTSAVGVSARWALDLDGFFAVTLGTLLLGFIGWLVAVAVIVAGTIRVTKVSKGSIRLTRVTPEFIDAYDEYCDRREEVGRGKLRLDPDVLQRWNEPRRRRGPDGRDDSAPAGEEYRPE